MHLRSLTLRGFKSFATSTTIELEPGITCVVGPNGSGKSNVVDAIAWVMGEQGAKSLRGGKMDDVIFAGTSGKAPLGRAEVELTIDNSDGALPIDYSEVTIRRTLFRSGGSEYAINGRTCRLLDIQELLSDSGIGREMHVIVGQGRLDAILHASPEDRRGFIEEAAGVLKHRRRKEKALRKLDQIHQNLQRLTDLAGELRRQLKPLGRQAEVARRAATIQADLRDARLRLLADDVAGVQRDLAREHADEAQAKAARERAESALGIARGREEALERRLQDLAPKLHGLRGRSLNLTRLREQTRALVALIAERRRSLEREQLELGLGVDPEELGRQAESASLDVLDQQRVLVDAQRELESARTATEDLGSRVREEQATVSAAERAASQYRQELVSAEQAVAGGRRLVESTRERVERLRTRLDAAQDEARGAAEAQAQLPQEEAVQDLPDVAGADSRMVAAEHDLRLGREELSAQQQRRASLTARCEALRAAVARDSADEVDASVHEGTLDGLVRVRPGYEKALAVLLGSHARATVLKQGVPFREVLQSLDADAATRLVVPGGARLDGLPARSALAYVDAPEHLRGPLAAMLRDCFIVDGLDDAERFLADAPGALVATLQGHVVGRGIAGQGSEGANVIALRNSLDQATEELVEAEAAWRRAQGHVQRLEAEFARARAERDEVRSEIAAHQARAAAGAEKALHVTARARDAARRLQQVEAELEEARTAHHAQAADLERAVGRLEDLRARGVPPVDRAALVGLVTEQESARRTHHERSLVARSAEERLKGMTARHRELIDQARRAREALEAAAVRRVQREEALATLGRLEEFARTTALLAEQDAGAAERDVEAVEAEQASLQSDHADARSRALEMAQEVDRLTRDVHRDEVLRAGKRATLDQLREKALEEFGLTLEDLVAEYGPDQPVPGGPEGEQTPFDRVAQQKRLKAAERGLALLGRVNPLALEEFAAMEERHTHLVNQIEDVKKSRDDLLGIVADVDARVQEVFAQAYTDVAREFEYTFGRLFPGGQGRLLLTDPDDMLSTGVDVEARPPGKKIKRLSLLSGGERSLTAVAFLVALFKARPSPFYLLDEVEAALDDVNLGRLIGLLEELRQTSQLLVITHQKRTMEIADALYGVTMRAGVSAVISQRMRQLQPV